MIFDPLRPTAFRAPGADGYIRTVLDVTPHWLDVALGVAEDAAVELGLAELLPEGVTVVPFRPCAPSHPDRVGPMAPIPNGFTMVTAAGDPLQEIFVRADMAPAALEATVAHEMRHVWQNLRGGHAFRSEEAAEADARRFELEWIAAHRPAIEAASNA
ncbi:hypothetical protein [Nocardioides sp. MH1]|uniref:hypothetical protein n=1 Tax=Nocardioides sp. MH1 TaxID=3242490 RepID=UPI003520AB98